MMYDGDPGRDEPDSLVAILGHVCLNLEFLQKQPECLGQHKKEECGHDQVGNVHLQISVINEYGARSEFLRHGIKCVRC